MSTNRQPGRRLYFFSALATALTLLTFFLLCLLILSRGLRLFWPAEVVQFQYPISGQMQQVFGEVVSRQQVNAEQLAAAGLPSHSQAQRVLIKQGQMAGQTAFRWYWQHLSHDWQTPAQLSLLRHFSQGEFYGVVTQENATELQLRLSDNSSRTFQRRDIERVISPNQLSLWGKLQLFAAQWWQFLSTEPRQANSAGGILPAIMGTVLSVLLMALLVAPIGIMAGIYLHEYAKDGRLVRLVRLSVHNLAGVPSVVFGVFALGFFVYVLGGSIDQLFYAEQLPQATFGTPGLLWVSLTLALLTLPVVIVATEEGLARIPQSLRLGGYALGATKAEVLRKLILPVAIPAMITGVVLAMSRAAGEVAPLIFVGVVKYAPVLPLRSEWPFVQLDQQIMSLGLQIYDVGLQSSNADAAEPRVYAIALVLLLLIGSLNLLAMRLRRYYPAKTRSQGA